MCSIQIKTERFTILFLILIVHSQAHTTLRILLSTEVATLVGSAEDSLADRAVVVVEDPAVADSNQRRIYVKRNDAQTSCQTGTGRVHAFKSTPFSGGLGELENTANELGIPIIPHETAVFPRFYCWIVPTKIF